MSEQRDTERAAYYYCEECDRKTEHDQAGRCLAHVQPAEQRYGELVGWGADDGEPRFTSR